MVDEYNQELLVELLNKAKGPERSMRKYALDAGISQVTLSRITTGARKATISHLQALTSEAANPQGGITLEELASAAGYINFSSNVADSTQLMGKEAVEKSAQLEIMVSGALQHHFVNSDDTVEFSKSTTKYYNPDISISIGNKIWWFEIVSGNWNVNSIFAKIVLVPPDKSRNFVIVVDSELMFECLSDCAGHVAFKGNLSVVYFNTVDMAFEKETILSTFDDTPFSMLT